MADRTTARAHDAATRICGEMNGALTGGERKLRAAEANPADAQTLHALLTEFAIFEHDEMTRTAEELQHDMEMGWFGCVFLETGDGTPVGYLMSSAPRPQTTVWHSEHARIVAAQVHVLQHQVQHILGPERLHDRPVCAGAVPQRQAG